jgi:hypothetical protein
MRQIGLHDPLEAITVLLIAELPPAYPSLIYNCAFVVGPSLPRKQTTDTKRTPTNMTDASRLEACTGRAQKS